ncbi:hypothetical protein SPL95_18285 [Pseudomonas canadensis]|uniref:Uncharacterized protein n=1 Tax=Pseudomonas canadensis TaxID=915099 RepID=A0ABZ0ZZS5_9PSED|nr:hypothetical protein [Pseudomonas canadensis]WRI22559.1 hypothetical protein SPL95_18285 [Pseudomonas canadensis]
MTAIQICALISIIFAAAILYWVGYRGGLIDGRIEGIEEGKAIQQSDNSGTIEDLKRLLEQAQGHYKQLYSYYERALAASKLGEPARQTLLDIAEKLRIAAETFSAFRTGKKLERDSLTLRDRALAMAALLGPVTPKLDPVQPDISITKPQGRWVIEREPTEAMCPAEARKAAQFFRTEAEIHKRNQKAVGGDV